MTSLSSYSVGSLRQRAGFTLIELLISCVLGLLMVVFLFQFFNAASGAWHSGTNQNDTFANARAALQLMERDISETTAAFRVNPYPTPTVLQTPTPTFSPTSTATPYGGPVPVLVIDRYPLPTPSFQSGDEINQELYCLTNIYNKGSSNLCAVGYYCAWMPDLIPSSDPLAAQRKASAPQAYALIRQYLGSGGYPTPTTMPTPSPTPPQGLFERLAAAKKSASNLPLSFIDVYQRGVPQLYPSPTPVTSPPVASATELCAYIWDLQFCTPKTLQGPTPMPGPTPTPEYPALPISSPKPTVTPASLPTPPDYYPATLPPYIEIRFKALSESAARQLEGNTSITRQTWNDASATSTTSSIYRNIILPGTRQFVARVPIFAVSSTPTPSPN